MEYNIKTDLKTVRDATYGAGCNTPKVASVLCARPPAYLQELAAAYKAEYKDDLRSVLEKETSGPVETLVTAGLRSESDTRALLLHSAVQGAGSNEGLIVDCILTCSFDEMKQLNETWTKRFGIPIMARLGIDGVIVGGLHYLLEQITCGNKPGGPVNHDAARMDCLSLIAAGESKVGTDEKAFAKVFSVRSRDHLVFLNEEYKNHSPKKWSLEQAIRSETSGAFQLALLCSIKTPEQWFAERFNAAMKGVGTKEADLVAALVLSGSHLKGAAATFKQQFSKDLRAEIAKELTGDLEKVVLAFLDFRLK